VCGVYQPWKAAFPECAVWHYFSLKKARLKCDVMDILMIVLALTSAYVLFVSVSYLLIRLLFPKIEVNDSDEVRPLKTRGANRYTPPRAIKKQKNLAY
jgi:hypothetical protein